MLRLLVFTALVHLSVSQQYQQKVAPGVPPSNYQNYQQPPPPPPPQQQQYQQQQQQYQQQIPQQQQQMPPQQMQQQMPPQQMQQQMPPQQMQQQMPSQPIHHGDPQLLNPANIAHERDHIQEHMEVPIDTSKMSEQELQFHYFKMHDADNNNKLDGCELIKSLIHWHDEKDATISIVDHIFENHQHSDAYTTLSKYKHSSYFDGEVDKNSKDTYSDIQLEKIMEYALEHTDINKDGYVDYLEYKISNTKSKMSKSNQ